MKKENLIFIEKAISIPEVVKLVNQASERIWHKIPDVTSFEHSCYRDIGIAIMTKKGIKSVVGISTRIVARKAAWHVKNRGRPEVVESLEYLAGHDDEGNEEPFEVQDVLADVENKLIRRETLLENAALLAKGDVRKNTIIQAWVEGYHNAKELSGVLANTFGGKSESHRKTIQRFEIECRKQLGVA